MATDKERLAIMETNISQMAEDIKEIKTAVKAITDELPNKADRTEVAEQIRNLGNARKLQNSLINIMICVSSSLITALVYYWASSLAK